jgi:hypothetical protein
MQELTSKKESNEIAAFSTLPSSAPLNKQAPGMAGNPAPAAPNVPDMTSAFGRKFEEYSNRDPNFTPMMQEFTALSSALKDQVDKGYMPKVMADRNLSQYIEDMRGMRTEEANKPATSSFDPVAFAENIRATANAGMKSKVGLDDNGVPKALSGVLRTLKAAQEAQNGTV